MSGVDPNTIKVIACDVFGTTVDWRSGVADQVTEISREYGIELDAGVFADAWRDRYRPALRRVNERERSWAYLDTLHRESLDELLDTYGISGVFDETARERLVRTWHRLPAWPDSVSGLARLGANHLLAALSNGGFALLTHLVKHAQLPFDCIVSAELARSYKPASTPYRTAAELLDVHAADMLMVASHGWDIDGAHSTGLHTAFLERPYENGPHRSSDRAIDVASELTVSGFHELADRLGCP